MSAFEVVAIIVGIFFAIGIAVGILLVAAVPWGGGRPKGMNDGSPWQLGGYQPDPRDQLDTGPPGEPDDRDDPDWRRRAGR